MADDLNAPATKRDLAALDGKVSALDGKVSALASRLDARMDDLSEQMRDMQTELLKAFLPWQNQVQIQFREIESNTSNSITAVKERMSIVERRLWEIEKRLLMNPPAA